MKVYLAGPINGCNDGESKTWREKVKKRLGESNCIDPMVRDYRGTEDQNVDEIVDLDKLDILASDVVLANCWQPSWGTAMEINFAWFNSKPVFCVVQEGTRISPWLRYHSRDIYSNLSDALDIIENISRKNK